MKIIYTKLRDMPSSLLAELGSYRYSVFARGDGWPLPARLSTPGQEYDRYDHSDVVWIIAWNAQMGICGCARLMPWSIPVDTGLMEGTVRPVNEMEGRVWEMSRFSARLDIDADLPPAILWHSVQLAEQAGIDCLYSAATPMLEQMFAMHHVDYQPLSAGFIQSEENLFAVKISTNQPRLASRFCGARRFSPEEVLPTFGVSPTWTGGNR
ncbi:autoinducer synthase [Erwinia tracheiphila]|uniref:Acyl-homoserine-lactone synthase n=1 Tax=Erwinia tracheiphila TaxID=65700 RepID=A0A0M2K7J4_9GAMM|nr:acyl-homoserine-lactone synthase [Erwinia tracheiphila]EOS96620.1 Autoinducer synthase [Erwinia tracheiphila PSU-1]KKF34904.1 autoinducer synthase [Erwinia tracheiphila]UIA86568.1 autoinducer synthase [Erwinia tracheiphila]UIA94921.1 autoinducer synthase [Erwinia tracheiphila]